MLYLIELGQINGEIGGWTDNPDLKVSGLEVIEGPDAPISEVYLEDRTVKVRSPQPTPAHFWSNSDCTWVLPEVPEPQIVPDWQKLLTAFLAPNNALYESILDKVLTVGGKAQWRLQNLQQFLLSPEMRQADGLAFAVKQLDAALTAGNKPLAAKEKTGWNKLMDECGFPANCKFE